MPKRRGEETSTVNPKEIYDREDKHQRECATLHQRIRELERKNDKLQAKIAQALERAEAPEDEEGETQEDLVDTVNDMVDILQKEEKPRSRPKGPEVAH
ncbi:MAG TPA: hypothetical protein VHM88_11240, partial [Candidatus Acidoferrales bacterium]|nr:hypothetical protein [Candidatus Acidoferrales bacterium]